MKFTALPLEQNAVTCRTAVIDFLALLLYEKPAPETVHPVYYTRSQAAIAKQKKSIITSDLSVQHTDAKYNFYGLYGQSIPQYTTHQRMPEAARRTGCGFPSSRRRGAWGMWIGASLPPRSAGSLPAHFRNTAEKRAYRPWGRSSS